MGRSRRLLALLIGALLVTALGVGLLRWWPRGVSAVAADGAGDPACAQVAAHWPGTAAGAARVAVRGEPAGVAAWGDPAIIARCGVTSPGPTTQDCIGVDGVDWVGRSLEDGMAFVSYGRTPAIEVLVPRRYAPEPMVLGAFADAARQVPQGEHRCS